MRALVTETTAAVNGALALAWKLGSGQDSKQTAQARGNPACARAVCEQLGRASAQADPSPRMQAVAVLFVASKVTSWFSFITLSYIGASAGVRRRCVASLSSQR